MWKAIEPVRVERVAGEDEQGRRLAGVFEVDAFGGPRSQVRGGAVEGREDEVAGVEEARGAAPEARGAAFEAAAGADDSDAGPAQPRLQRVGALESFGEARAQRFGAAGEAGDAGGELGGAVAEAGDAVAYGLHALDQALGFPRQALVRGEDFLAGVGDVGRAVAELAQGLDRADQERADFLRFRRRLRPGGPGARSVRPAGRRIRARRAARCRGRSRSPLPSPAAPLRGRPDSSGLLCRRSSLRAGRAPRVSCSSAACGGALKLRAPSSSRRRSASAAGSASGAARCGAGWGPVRSARSSAAGCRRRPFPERRRASRSRLRMLPARRSGRWVPPVGATEPAGEGAGAVLGASRALRQQAGAVGGFGDPVADLADPGCRPRQAAADPADVRQRALRRRRRAAGSPCSRSGSTEREIAAGPTTACTPGSLAIFRCQRPRAASRAGSVIGPCSVAATTTKGDSKPGPTDRARSSLSCGPDRPLQLGRAGRPGLQAEGRERQGEDDDPDQDRDRRRAAQGGGYQRHQPRRRPGRAPRARSASGRRWRRAG